MDGQDERTASLADPRHSRWRPHTIYPDSGDSQNEAFIALGGTCFHAAMCYLEVFRDSSCQMFHQEWRKFPGSVEVVVPSSAFLVSFRAEIYPHEDYTRSF